MKQFSFYPRLTFFLLFLLSCTTAIAKPEHCLVIKDDAGKAVFRQPVLDGDRFAISFRHSVALSPVTDYYKVEDGKIVLDKTIYHDFGAGLPHETAGDEKMKTENGEIILTGLNRELPGFAVRVGRVAGHRLLLFDRNSAETSGPSSEIPFTGLASPGQALHFMLESATE